MRSSVKSRRRRNRLRVPAARAASRDWQAERDAFMRQFRTWRADWESLDTGRYLGHYARDFRSDGMDLAGWQAHKRRVNEGKTWIRVSLNNVTAFRSPGKQSLIAVTFDQDYRSDNRSQRTRKRQYWVMEDGGWKIEWAEGMILPELTGGNSLAMEYSIPSRGE